GDLVAVLGPHGPLAVALVGGVMAARGDLAVRVVLDVVAVELAVLVLDALEHLAGGALLDARLGEGGRGHERDEPEDPHGASTPFSTSSAPTRTGLPSRLWRSLCETETFGAKAAAWKASSDAVPSPPFLPPPQPSWVPRSSVRQAQTAPSLVETATRKGAPSTTARRVEPLSRDAAVRAGSLSSAVISTGRRRSSR